MTSVKHKFSNIAVRMRITILPPRRHTFRPKLWHASNNQHQMKSQTKQDKNGLSVTQYKQ